MLPTIKLTDITEKWRAAIRASTEINNFCQQNYGKPLKIYMGLNAKKTPEKEDCPYVIIFPGKKLEGAGKSEYSYLLSIGWCIANGAASVIDNDVLHPGVIETDTLGELIWATIAEINPSCPLTDLDYDIETNAFVPQYPGRMDITLTVPVTFGYDLTY